MTHYRANQTFTSVVLYTICFFVTLLVLVPLYISVTGGAKLNVLASQWEDT